VLQTDYLGLFVGNAFYAVDAFFYIGGFFLAYTLLQGSKKKLLNSKLNSLKIIFLR
jgi:peptidoglycan/LPS O-acetylase OafA/YrhL